MEFVVYQIFITLSIIVFSSAEVILISNKNCSDAKCLEQAWSYAATHYSENVTFHVEGTVNLAEVSFQYAANVTILGIGDYSELVCSSSCWSCGLEFFHTRSILLQNLTITGCGALGNFEYKTLNYTSAVILRNCTDISLNNVTVRNSRGYGAVLINSVGNVIVSHSYFLNSTIDGELLGGAGMHILCDNEYEYPCPKSILSASYLITDCFFKNSQGGNKPIRHVWDYTYTGGIKISINYGANNNFKITDSYFCDNHGTHASGLSLIIAGNSKNNMFLIQDSLFARNTQLFHDTFGGAGAAIGITSFNYENFPNENIVTFERCHFTSNVAYFGAGTVVFSAAGYEVNHLHFNNCSWRDNRGIVSPALDIGSDGGPRINRNSFIMKTGLNDCTFLSNVAHYQKKFMPNRTMYEAGLGVMVVSQLTVQVGGETLFANNLGCALVLFSAQIIFEEEAVTTFTNNSGYTGGGALVLYEYSNIRYKNNTLFNFTNNWAAFMGGAIYATKYSEHAQYSSFGCIIQHYNYITTANRVHFHFKNNSAGYNYANSIYFSSVKPCQEYCRWFSKNPSANNQASSIFSSNSCLGHFHFHDQRPNEFGTEGSKVFLDHLSYITPGQVYYLPLNITDDFGNDANAITTFQAEVDQNASHIKVDPAYRYVTNSTIILDGGPGSRGELLLTNIHNHEILRLEIQLSPCAPGFVKSDTQGHTKCVCSALVGGKHYPGVVECHDGKAMIAPGVWIGYVGEEANEHTLYTGSCIHGYCKDFNPMSNKSRFFPLISTASKKKLEQLICAKNRNGVLCGSCIADHSVFYHSNTFSCSSNDLCDYGFIFYVLSELLPTTILFLLILFFNVNLTSGYGYSVIFMAQTIHSMGLLIDTESENSWTTPIDIALMFYGVSNLNFFNLNKLSFCLWKDASTLAVLAMQYVAVLFALGLIVSTVVMVNYCNCARITRCLCKIKCISKRRISFVNGLTAFSVICYSKCALTSFYLLNYTQISGKGGAPYNYTLVHLSGTRYFDGKHCIYAILAIVTLNFIVIPLAVILLGDTFFLKLEHLFNKSCSSQKNCYPWTRFRQEFKPLFDHFQGCFKDEYRFVSGLFFIYRIVFLLVLVVTPNLDLFYGTEQIVLLFILAVQAFLQPFQKTKHNLMAVLVFFNLSLINCLSMIIHLLKMTSLQYDRIYAFRGLQITFMYLPIFCGLCWCIWRGLQWAYNKKSHCGYSYLSDEDHPSQSDLYSLNHSAAQ